MAVAATVSVFIASSVTCAQNIVKTVASKASKAGTITVKGRVTNVTPDITTKLTSVSVSKDSAAAAALNATDSSNSSTLNIHGALRAGGGINLNSTATTNTSASLGLNLAFGQNLSKLNVSRSADINAGGKLNVAALANAPFKVQTTFQRKGNGLGALTLSGGKLVSYALTSTSGNVNIESANVIADPRLERIRADIKTNTDSASSSLLASGSFTRILNRRVAAATVYFKNINIRAPTANGSVAAVTSKTAAAGRRVFSCGGSPRR